MANLESDIRIEFVPCPPEHAEAWRAGVRILWGMMDRAAQELVEATEEIKNDN